MIYELLSYNGDIELGVTFDMKRYAVILAAGQGTRMKSKLYKVLHPILGRPMIQYVVEALTPSKIEELVTIVGHGAEEVSKEIGSQSEYVIQEEQLGTAHAVMQAKETLAGLEGTTIVVCGDTPLITEETFKNLFDYHENTASKATVLTTEISNPTGYGRVIRDDSGNVSRIVEHKDASQEELSVKEINTGTYCFDNKALFEALEKVDNNNAQGEYYLPDVVEILKKDEEKISAYLMPDQEESIGINDRVALAEAEAIMKRRINKHHLKNGVTISDIDNTYIGPDVDIEQDAYIYPGTTITGNSSIKSDTVIGPNSEIHNCIVGEGSTVRQSVVSDSKIGNQVDVGPFANIRPETDIGNDVKVGNFVELKKTSLGNDTKVSHLTYLGDAELGENVNVGCGSITVNYDGVNKHQTKIESNAFIGCNTNLMAPVTIEEGAFIAAGSTITKDVPKESLAIARAKQENKEGYARKIKERNQNN